MDDHLQRGGGGGGGGSPVSGQECAWDVVDDIPDEFEPEDPRAWRGRGFVRRWW